MKTVNTISRKAAFVWLWRNDAEAKWYWFRCWAFSRCNLNECVKENYRDFGFNGRKIWGT